MGLFARDANQLLALKGNMPCPSQSVPEKGQEPKVFFILTNDCTTARSADVRTDDFGPVVYFLFRWQVLQTVKIHVITMVQTQTRFNIELEISQSFHGCQIIFIFMVPLVLLPWKLKNIILVQ